MSEYRVVNDDDKWKKYADLSSKYKWKSWDPDYYRESPRIYMYDGRPVPGHITYLYKKIATLKSILKNRKYWTSEMYYDTVHEIQNYHRALQHLIRAKKYYDYLDNIFKPDPPKYPNIDYQWDKYDDRGEEYYVDGALVPKHIAKYYHNM